jgi:hypothetical protein
VKSDLRAGRNSLTLCGFCSSGIRSWARLFWSCKVFTRGISRGKPSKGILAIKAQIPPKT